MLENAGPCSSQPHPAPAEFDLLNSFSPALQDLRALPGRVLATTFSKSSRDAEAQPRQRLHLEGATQDTCCRHGMKAHDLSSVVLSLTFHSCSLAETPSLDCPRTLSSLYMSALMNN